MSSLSFLKKNTLTTDNRPFSKWLPVIFLFVFSAVLVPLAGPAFLLLLPMVLFLNGAFNGLLKTAAVFLMAYALLVLIAFAMKFDIPAVAVFILGAAGMLMAQRAGKHDSVERIIIYPSLLIAGAVCFYFIDDAVALSVHPWQLVKNYITLAVEENVRLYGQLPLKAEDINFIKDNQETIIKGFIHIFPSLVVIFSVMTVWINLLIGKNYLNRAGIVYPGLTSLAQWKMPEKMIWLFLASGLLLFVPEKTVNFFTFNVFLVICFLYFLQGLTIISFLFQLKNVPSFFRYFFYFLIAVQQILMIPVITIGLFDMWFDFRKLMQKKSDNAMRD